MAVDSERQKITPAASPRELSAEEAVFAVPAADLAFKTTADMAVSPDWVGRNGRWRRKPEPMRISTRAW